MALIFVDCEADFNSPCPGIGLGMTEFGAVEFNSRKSFYGKPIIDRQYSGELSNFSFPYRADEADEDFRKWYDIMIEFDQWLHQFESPYIFISDNPAYDWQWINYWFHRVLNRNPFGHCLVGDDRIIMEKGTMPIREIVTKKHQGPILSLNKDGSLSFKKVIEWHSNYRAGRSLVCVEFLYSSRRGSIFTAEHKLLSKGGWKTAGDIKTGDLLFTGELAPSEDMYELIDGTLLGDSSINKGGCYGFSQTNIDYATLKRKALHLLGAKEKIQSGRDFKVNNKVYKSNSSLRVWLPNRIWSKQERERWYPNGKKCVPQDLRLSDLSLAVWFMDDGCSYRCFSGNQPYSKKHRWTGTLSTQGFNDKDLTFLCRKLNNMGVVVNQNSKRVLYLTVNGFAELSKRIGKYVPPSMRYKLPDDSPPFQEKLWSFSQPLVGSCPVKVKNIILSSRSKFNKVYCIQVEDNGNFILFDGGVAQNSARRIGDFYAGLVGNFRAGSKWKRLRITKHDHNPVNDALGNCEAFQRILEGER